MKILAKFLGDKSSAYPADEMLANPISTLVNSPKNDVPAGIEASA